MQKCKIQPCKSQRKWKEYTDRKIAHLHSKILFLIWELHWEKIFESPKNTKQKENICCKKTPESSS